ncbi:MAG: TIGR03862 family flavoprotein [Pseudomonadota bacterium]
MIDCLVIGGGPAGLMAADEVSKAGHRVTVIDAMPSLGRKFLMAGKSGLNLTKMESRDTFVARYFHLPEPLQMALAGFGPEDVVTFAEDLGQACFVGTTGRVFPKVMKASPMLRAWLALLQNQGVRFETRTKWINQSDGHHCVETPEGQKTIPSRSAVFAMGGASWPKLGSTGSWRGAFNDMHLECRDFAPSNVSIRIDWSTHMSLYFGRPLKAVRFSCRGRVLEGEATLTKHGLEGGPIYAASPDLRNSEQLFVDLVPAKNITDIETVLAKARPKETLTNTLRKGLGMSSEKLALLHECGRPLPQGTELAALIKALPVRYDGVGSLERAISSAGGLDCSLLSHEFMLQGYRGLFAAGEMLDWDAPTGGYLLTACFASGRAAGQGVNRYLSAPSA